MGQYRFSPDTVSKLFEMVAAGESASAAGKVLGIAGSTARELVQSARVNGPQSVIDKVASNYNGNAVALASQPVTKRHDLTPSTAAYVEKHIAPDPDPLGRLILPRLPDTVMVIPDLQFPYALPQALPFLSMVAQRYCPDAVIGIGDEVDNFFLSAYEKDPDALEGRREYEVALEQCSNLFSLFPKVSALHSNHGRGRLEKARIRGGLLRSMVPDYQTFIGAPRGWGFYDEVRMGDVIFAHGDGEKTLNRAFIERHVPNEYGRHYSVVHGHRHESVGRQAEISVGEKDYWCAYTGALINPRAAAFSYTKARKAKLGCIVIVHGEVKRVRYLVDDLGNWRGEL